MKAIQILLASTFIFSSSLGFGLEKVPQFAAGGKWSKLENYTPDQYFTWKSAAICSNEIYNAPKSQYGRRVYEFQSYFCVSNEFINSDLYGFSMKEMNDLIVASWRDHTTQISGGFKLHRVEISSNLVEFTDVSFKADIGMEQFAWILDSSGFAQKTTGAKAYGRVSCVFKVGVQPEWECGYEYIETYSADVRELAPTDQASQENTLTAIENYLRRVL